MATPVNWKQGGDVIILPAVSDEEARATYPNGWQQPLPYIRVVRPPWAVGAVSCRGRRRIGRRMRR